MERSEFVVYLEAWSGIVEKLWPVFQRTNSCVHTQTIYCIKGILVDKKTFQQALLDQGI